jgi:hypothetical protein
MVRDVLLTVIFFLVSVINNFIQSWRKKKNFIELGHCKPWVWCVLLSSLIVWHWILLYLWYISYYKPFSWVSPTQCYHPWHIVIRTAHDILAEEKLWRRNWGYDEVGVGKGEQNILPCFSVPDWSRLIIVLAKAANWVGVFRKQFTMTSRFLSCLEMIAWNISRGGILPSLSLYLCLLSLWDFL